jgi:hypothetical protein
MPIGLLNSQLIKDLRTSLLVRNLNPTTEATLGGVSSQNSNRGLPAETSLPQGEYVPFNQDSVSSLGYYQLQNLGLKNRYAPSQYPTTEITDISAIAGNIGTYDEFVRSYTTRTFDLKQFVLNSPTLIGYQDTPLGIIGAEQLKFNLEANIGQNIKKNTLGRINTNVFSLLNGEELLIRDYQVTVVPNTPLGFFANLAQKYSGFEIPKSYIPKSAIGFLDSLFDGKVNYADCNLQALDNTSRMGMGGTIARNNQLLRFTGRGNRIQLFNMLGTNKYRPDYDSQNGGGALNRIFGFLQQQHDNAAASYDTLEKTRRHSGVLPVMLEQNIAAPLNSADKGKTGAFVKNDARSVLQPNGIPRITWDDKGIKKFMFSIENLAWIGNTYGLPTCEIGNGDPNSNDDRPGRIMWFPPYDLSFDESVSVAWDKTNFIGRGEPIFTYNNTTRGGTIKFKIVVDHPSILNEIRGVASDTDILKFFEGCEDYVDRALATLTEKQNTFASSEQRDATEQKIVNAGAPTNNKEFNATTVPGGTDSFQVKIYFPNDSSQVINNYQNGTDSLTGTTAVDSNLPNAGQTFLPGIDLGYNARSYDNGTLGFQSPEAQQKINDLKNIANDIESLDIKITVSNTATNTAQVNSLLADNRFTNAAAWVKGELSPPIPASVINITNGGYVDVPVTANSNSTNPEQIENRFALLDITVRKKDLKTSGSTTVDPETYSNDEVQDKVITIVKKYFTPVYTECDYFKYLETNVPFLFEKLTEKLKYFTPGFHSTTPEGLNSRLTFLHQCTRQGPSIDPNKNNRSNLAFGRPPICILRIGDFFHTKMVIESMSIQYDEGVLWDLNPEGIGVQPRLATVSLNVSYIGGQSLSAPIKELQNALGFHFYANTETFQHAPRLIEITTSLPVAENVKKKDDAVKPNNLVPEPTLSNILNYGNYGSMNNTTNVQIPYALPDSNATPVPEGQKPFIGPPNYNFNNYVDSPVGGSPFNNITNQGGGFLNA